MATAPQGFANSHLAVHELLREPSAEHGENSFFGPAHILAVEGRTVLLTHDDGPRRARLALAQSYRAVAGDEVLAIGRGDDWYVIGLLQGSGETVLTAPGDITIAAPTGRVEIMARDGVSLKGSLVELVAEKLEFTARHSFERFTDLTQWVTDAVHKRLGRERTHVEGDYDLKAGRITELADDDVSIDGRKIYLG